MDTLEKFETVGFVADENGCWLWCGPVDQNGYGLIYANYTRVRAPRFALGLKLGHPVPRGVDTRHTCDTPLCVRPEHLVPGTRAENVADMVERGRHRTAAIIMCPSGHEYTEENTYRMPSRPNARYCRACRRGERVTGA